MKISYDTYSKEWLLWVNGKGILFAYKTKKEAEDVKLALEKANADKSK